MSKGNTVAKKFALNRISLSESLFEDMGDPVTAIPLGSDEKWHIRPFTRSEALVTLEDEDGNTKRIHKGDFYEFYVHLDIKGNVIHDPEEMEDFDEDYGDDPNTYDSFFRVLDNIEHIAKSTMEWSDEEWTPASATQTAEMIAEQSKELSDIAKELVSRDDTNESFNKGYKIVNSSNRNKKSVKEATMTRRMTRDEHTKEYKKLNRDIWSQVYNELNGDIKDSEAPDRSFKISRFDRYHDDDLSFDDAIIKVGADSEEGLKFAKEVADYYGIPYDVKENKSRYATHKFVVSLYTDKSA